MAHKDADFAFKEGLDVFSPKDLIELGRPGSGVANQAGDLVLVPYSEYSIAAKENKKAVHVVPLQSSAHPLRIPLPKGGDVFWLTSRILGHAIEGTNGTELHAIDLNLSIRSGEVLDTLTASDPPTLIGSFPTKTAANFRYSLKSGYLVFSDCVWSDGNLSTVQEQDKNWEDRGNTAYVYDTTYERHWDTWVGKKRPALFSVKLVQDPDRKWIFGNDFHSPLRGTGHQCPVEPFGGIDDFDVSETHIIYTTKDPKLPEAWHTKQNVYIVDITGQNPPKELTSGKQGAIHSPVINAQGTRAAWLELDEDGYESDRAKIVIYDLEKDVRYTLTQKWDRSPDSLTFSKEGTFIYFTAGDEAKVKVWALPIPPTPSESTVNPDLLLKYTTPVALTQYRSASSLQPLFSGGLIFTQSSFTSPNDVFIIRDLKRFEAEVLQSDDIVPFKGEIEQVTRLTESALKGKVLSEGEEFWFKGANGRDVQGWVLKPGGLKDGDKKKWPIVLLIHGGPQGAWEDQWSTRWNPNVFTQQGYFVVAINPTGSTTFGQEFTDAIAEDWGGKPFVDMRNGWQYILNNYPQVDPDRAVAAGASWGGYAINWIQGHPEYGFNFKALVCHDGVFDSTYNGYSTDELFFFNHEWGGRPWEQKSKELSQRYGPSNFVHKWSTPQLLIHGSKDYRLPETESIGAFHALQQLGIPSRLVVFPDENHWVLNHGNSLKWHYEVFRWFDKFVGEKGMVLS
jgi:dipeptidyl aminopeptidase/acylaminoacyl peptidase